MPSPTRRRAGRGSSASSTAAEADTGRLLRSYGLRSTAQRLAILNTIEAADPGDDGRPTALLTVAEIHDRLRANDNHIDLSTIYRTVTRLVNLGVLHAIAHKDQPVAYGLAVHAHHHAVCIRCGAVNDIPADRLAPTLPALREVSGFRAQEVRITVHGLCADCLLA